MRKIFKVFKRDIKNIIKNPVAIIIVIGLSLIPSLYAWVNIKACWNPYANTGEIPVAVVNNDNGTNFNGTNINVGNQIIEELKKNKDIGWRFVSDWQGNYGLNEGDYYALIEIPSNFSSDLTSLATKDPIKPNIIYKANEKVNAIATKITDVAEEKLTDEIKSNFIDTVNKEAFNYLNKFGENVKKNESNILELKNTIDDAQNSLTKIQNYLDKSTKSVNEVSSYLNSVKGDLPSVTNQINDLQGMVYGNKDLVSSTQVGIQNISNGVKNDLLQMQMVTDKYNGLLNKLNEINSSNVDVKSIDKTIDDMQSALDTLNTIINNSKKTLETINSKYPSNSIQTQIDKLDAMQSFISKDKEQLKSLKSLIDSGKIGESTNNAIKNLTDLNSSFSNNLSSASNNFYNNTLPNLNNIVNTLSKGSDTANSLLESSKAIVPQLNALASFGIASGDLANSQMNTVKTRLDDFKNKVSKIQSETNNITSDSLNEAINTMSKRIRIRCNS